MIVALAANHEPGIQSTVMEEFFTLEAVPTFQQMNSDSRGAQGISNCGYFSSKLTAGVQDSFIYGFSIHLVAGKK